MSEQQWYETPEGNFVRGTKNEPYNDNIKLKVPITIWIAAGAVLVLMVLSFFRLSGDLQDYKLYTQARRMAKDGMLYSAMENMQEVITLHPDSQDIIEELIDLAMQHRYYDYAAYIMDEYLVGKTVDDALYSKLNRYYILLERYYDTWEAIDEIFLELAQEDISPGQTIDLSPYYSKAEALLEENTYDKAYIYYALAYLSQDADQYAENLRLCLEKSDGYYLDAAANYANTFRRKGDFTTAKQMLEDSYLVNCENSATIRSLAIMYMLEEDFETASSFAFEAYDIDPEGMYVADTYIISLWAAGYETDAKQIKTLLEAQDYYFDEELDMLLDGKTSLYDYYTGGLD